MSLGMVAPTEAEKFDGAGRLLVCLLMSLQAVRCCERVSERLSFGIVCMADEFFDIACCSTADAAPIPDVSAAIVAMAIS
jgi:hypothetical protein